MRWQGALATAMFLLIVAVLVWLGYRDYRRFKQQMDEAEDDT